MESQKALFSKFDPQPDPAIKPSMVDVPVQSALAVPAKPVEEKKEKAKRPEIKAKKAPKDANAKGKLELGAGYSISHREGSGYSIITKILTEECHFAEAAESLESKEKNKKTILWMSVDRIAFEDTIKATAAWKVFAQKKYEVLKKRASDGDDAAQKTLQNKSRVVGSTWVGNIPEMLSVMCGSGNADNRNVWKFQNAGVTIAMFELDGKQRLTIYPAKFNAFFKQALASCQ